MMTTTTQQPLWIHDDGRLACQEHAGHYAQAVLGRRPTAKLVETPLGTWERLTLADRAQLAEMTGRAAVCEICEAKIRNRQHIQLVK
jgi:hypothetical protein